MVRAAKPVSAGGFADPVEVPTEIVPEAALDLGIEGGLAGGVEGGVPGGVVGGIVGGLPDAPPPPPTGPVRVGLEVQEPRKLKHVPPVYPSIAAESRLECYARALRRRPLTQEILAWETVQSNPLTAILEGVRERLGLAILEAFAPESAAADVDLPAVSAVLAGAINYLVVRSRTVRVFNGVEIGTEEGWHRIEHAVGRLSTGLLGPAGGR